MDIDPHLKKTYGEILEDYCGIHGISIPAGFNTRKCHKFAIIDQSATPNKLCALTTYMVHNVTEIIAKLESEKGAREWMVIDLKRCCTVQIEVDQATKLEGLGVEKYRPSPI